MDGVPLVQPEWISVGAGSLTNCVECGATRRIYIGCLISTGGPCVDEGDAMYSAQLIQQLYNSALFSAAVVEAPDGLEIVSSVAMYMSGAKYPVLLYRSAIRLMDPDFDGSANAAEKMAVYLNRVCCYPVFAEMVKSGRGVMVRA